MIIATVTGNLGRDAELKNAGGTQVLSFSVASTKKDRNGEQTHWIDCSIWGQRGESLAQYLSKGTRVTVVGELTTREHNGKTYLQIRVDQLDFGGSKRDGGSDPKQQRREEPTRPIPDDYDIPF